MTWEWILLGFVWLGIRKSATLRELIGGRWESTQDFFLDVRLCGSVLDLRAVRSRNWRQANASRPGRQAGKHAQAAGIACAWLPAGTGGLVLRQRHRRLLRRNPFPRIFAAAVRCDQQLDAIGVLLSATVFGASHGYEDAARMLLIGIYGLMFGLLAWWRNSLRPGMMAHAWHDAFSGVILRMLK